MRTVLGPVRFPAPRIGRALVRASRRLLRTAQRGADRTGDEGAQPAEEHGQAKEPRRGPYRLPRQQHVHAVFRPQPRHPPLTAHRAVTERGHPRLQRPDEFRQPRPVVRLLLEQRHQLGGERGRRRRVARVDAVVGLHAHQQQHPRLLAEALQDPGGVAREAAVEDHHDPLGRAGRQHRQYGRQRLRAEEHGAFVHEHLGAAHLQVQLVGRAGDGTVPGEVEQQHPVRLVRRLPEHPAEVVQGRRVDGPDPPLIEDAAALQDLAHPVHVVLDRGEVAGHTVRRLGEVVLRHADQQRPVHPLARAVGGHRATCRRRSPVRLPRPADRRPPRHPDWRARPPPPASPAPGAPGRTRPRPPP